MLEQLDKEFQVKRDEIGDFRIETKNGFAFEAGDHLLGFWIRSRRPRSVFRGLRRKILKLHVSQVGDREAVFLAPFSSLKDASRTLRAAGARRRRRLDISEVERQRRREQGRRLAAHRRKKVQKASWFD